jgi:hypothetical protein
MINHKLKFVSKSLFLFWLSNIFIIFIFYFYFRKNNHNHQSNEMIINKYKKIRSNNLFDNKTHETTIISMYFYTKSKKHNKEEYLKWIRNFFLSVTGAPLVFFTDNESLSKELLDLRKNHPTTF